MAALWEYALAVASHWVALMSSGPWLFDKIVKFFDIDLSNKISKIYPGLLSVSKIRVAINISIIGLIIASFLAFNGERNLLIAVRNNDSATEVDTVASNGTDQLSATPVSGTYTIVTSSIVDGGVVLKPINRKPLTIKNNGLNSLLVH